MKSHASGNAPRGAAVAFQDGSSRLVAERKVAMTNAYDPKIIALSALGLACFTLGFSMTAVAYPRAARSETVTHAANAAPSVLPPRPAARAARGCRAGE